MDLEAQAPSPDDGVGQEKRFNPYLEDSGSGKQRQQPQALRPLTLLTPRLAECEVFPLYDKMMVNAILLYL